MPPEVGIEKVIDAARDKGIDAKHETGSKEYIFESADDEVVGRIYGNPSKISSEHARRLKERLGIDI